ncbi:DciA family protein [Streptomyces sp. or20]|uniref:DciA family protein n=1 Tax=Streptomyces sp. or20 TaxID=1828016 RepID=UPI0015CF3245|nr:DciA family protein [Streptomyces sp. or20]
MLLQQAIGEFTQKAGWFVSPAVVTLWSEISPEIARRVFITRIDEASGVLHLSADSRAWATQMRVLAPMLVPRFNEAAQSSGIGPIRSMRVSGPGDQNALGVPGGPRVQRGGELPHAFTPTARTNPAEDPLLADAFARQIRTAPKQTSTDQTAGAPVPPGVEASARPRALLRAREEKGRPQSPTTTAHKVVGHEDAGSNNAVPEQGGTGT